MQHRIDSLTFELIVMATFTGPDQYNRVDLKDFGGHKDEVNCVAFSPDFEMMVTGSDDQRVRVFNAISGKFVVKVKGHTGAVRAVAVAPNSKHFVSAGYDKTICVWRTRDAQLVHRLEGHSKSIECLAFTLDSCILCSGSWDRSAILWDVESGRKLRVYTGHKNLVQAVAFSHNNKYLATGSWDHLVRLITLGDLHIDTTQTVDVTPSERYGCHVNHKTEICVQLEGHHGNVHTVAFSKEGMLASGSWDKTIRLWNPRTGHCLHTLNGHMGWVQAVSFSQDSLWLASAGEDDTVKVWDCVSGNCVKTLEGHTDTLQQCGFSPGGALVASGAAAVTLAFF